MIKFSGDLSEDCKYYYLKNAQKGIFSIIIIVEIPFIIGVLALAKATDWSALIMIIPMIFLILCASFPPETKVYNKLNNKLYYQDIHCEIEIIDEVIYASALNRNESNDFIDVKKVVDMGDWYKFYFYFPHKSNIFICEKKSLVEGTLEEFEELFQDRLVRLNHKN